MMRTTIPMLPGEHWWGGVTASAACPLTEKTKYREDLRDGSTSPSNQSMPLFVSDKGRYIWSDEPFLVTVENGLFTFEGGVVAVTVAGETLRDAYLAAMTAHFPPRAVEGNHELPDIFFTGAQYNSWMEFTYYPTQEGILRYAREWLSHGYAPGILTIDEGWQRQYGRWEFDPEKFPDPVGMTRELHAMGFRVMLWVVPYVRADGVEYVRSIRPLKGTDPEEAAHLYLRTRDGKVAAAEWWNGYSALLDMTDEWNRAFLDRQLAKLMDEVGIDGFKFDGGSIAGYSPDHFINGPVATDRTAQQLNQAWNAFGCRYEYHEYKDSYGMGGVRAIARLRDKGCRWDGDGINMYIPCAVTAGLIGHPFICPDMIGGGEWSYRFLPGFEADGELFVRMAQCAALFPMMQFSWAPWTVLNEEEQAACLAAARLHARMGSEILSLVREAERTGEPILRALEYNDPGKGYADITDEFMLGRDILVAPVIKKGQREREVTFPTGEWADEDGKRYAGGTKIVLKSPTGKLLWFRRVI